MQLEVKGNGRLCRALARRRAGQGLSRIVLKELALLRLRGGNVARTKQAVRHYLPSYLSWLW